MCFGDGLSAGLSGGGEFCICSSLFPEGDNTPLRSVLWWFPWCLVFLADRMAAWRPTRPSSSRSQSRNATLEKTDVSGACVRSRLRLDRTQDQNFQAHTSCGGVGRVSEAVVDTHASLLSVVFMRNRSGTYERVQRLHISVTAVGRCWNGYYCRFLVAAVMFMLYNAEPWDRRMYDGSFPVSLLACVDTCIVFSMTEPSDTVGGSNGSGEEANRTALSLRHDDRCRHWLMSGANRRQPSLARTLERAAPRRATLRLFILGQTRTNATCFRDVRERVSAFGLVFR